MSNIVKAKDIKKLIKDQDAEIDDLKYEISNAYNEYKYQLAANDNTVKKYLKEVDNTKAAAMAKFAKELLEVRDHLQMTIQHAKRAQLEDNSDIKKAKKEFIDLLNGVKITSEVFDKTMKKFNIEEFNPMGLKFKPDLHEAMFMMNDPTKEPETV